VLLFKILMLPVNFVTSYIKVITFCPSRWLSSGEICEKNGAWLRNIISEGVAVLLASSGSCTGWRVKPLIGGLRSNGSRPVRFNEVSDLIT